MLAKLVKFVILSRFSKYLLAFFVFFVFYDIFTPRSFQGTGFLSFFGPGMLAIVLSVPIVAGGVATLKSDRDFLFLLPVSRFHLAISLLFAQFIAYGLMAFFLVGYYIPLSGLSSLYPLLVFLSLGFAAASLSSIFFPYSLQTRLVFSFLMATWCLSSIAGFKFSPGSVFSSTPSYGAASIFLLVSVTLPLALLSLSRSELGLMKSVVSSTSKEAGKQKSFEGLSPLKAIFAYHFSIIEVSGRLNVPGGAAYRSARISIWKAAALTSSLAVLYFFVTLKFNGIIASKFNFGIADPLVFISSIYITISPAFMGIVALGNERLWLGFSAVNPYFYLRSLAVAKALSLFVMLSPFVVVDLLLGLMGYSSGFYAAVAISFISPSCLVLMIYLYGLLSPLQIREDVYMPGQAGLKQVIGGLSVFLAIFLTVFSLTSIYVAVLCSALIVCASAYVLKSKYFASRILKSMVESGFV